MYVYQLKLKSYKLQHSAFKRLERLRHFSIRCIVLYIYMYENFKHF